MRDEKVKTNDLVRRYEWAISLRPGAPLSDIVARDNPIKAFTALIELMKKLESAPNFSSDDVEYWNKQILDAMVKIKSNIHGDLVYVYELAMMSDVSLSYFVSRNNPTKDLEALEKLDVQFKSEAPKDGDGNEIVDWEEQIADAINIAKLLKMKKEMLKAEKETSDESPSTQASAIQKIAQDPIQQHKSDDLEHMYRVTIISNPDVFHSGIVEQYDPQKSLAVLSKLMAEADINPELTDRYETRIRYLDAIETAIYELIKNHPELGEQGRKYHEFYSMAYDFYSQIKEGTLSNMELLGQFEKDASTTYDALKIAGEWAEERSETKIVNEIKTLQQNLLSIYQQDEIIQEILAMANNSNSSELIEFLCKYKPEAQRKMTSIAAVIASIDNNEEAAKFIKTACEEASATIAKTEERSSSMDKPYTCVTLPKSGNEERHVSEVNDPRIYGSVSSALKVRIKAYLNSCGGKPKTTERQLSSTSCPLHLLMLRNIDEFAKSGSARKECSQEAEQHIDKLMKRELAEFEKSFSKQESLIAL
jgi:hypothetical protein